MDILTTPHARLLKFSFIHSERKMSDSNPEEETISTWNDMAQMYYDRFMDVVCYEVSYDSFLSRLRSIREEDTAAYELLDIGCGPGIIGKYFLSSSLSDRIHLTGIDAAPNMIDIAAKHFPMYSWLTMDARQINTRLQQTYHGILIGFCIPYLSADEVQALFTNASNLLHSKGILYMSFVPGSPELSGYKSNNKGQRVYFQYHEEETVNQWLEAAGFTNIQRHAIDFPRPNNQTEIHLALIAEKAL